MWKNIVERGRPQMTIWRMRIVCWIPKAINTNSEYVLLIAFPLQQWLYECASMLRYTYISQDHLICDWDTFIINIYIYVCVCVCVYYVLHFQISLVSLQHVTAYRQAKT